ncbi:D-alanyl-D-alanine carboxypeptidase [Deinococcus sp. KSM4-11]|nr:D-alanyl-D-alanine carboxypeptidase [Deinococcus sp. KSM4-11]
MGLGVLAAAQVPSPATLTLHRDPANADLAPSAGVRTALCGLPRGTRTGLLVVDLTDGQVLEDLAPDTPLIPASVTKLVTAASVLTDRGGAAGWWSTDLTVPAVQVGRAQVTTLTLRGSGDPTLEATRGAYSLRALAVQAYGRGLRDVDHVRIADQTLGQQTWAGEPIGAPMTSLRLAGWHDRPPATAAQARERLGAALIVELRQAGIRVASDRVESAPTPRPYAPPIRKDAQGHVLPPAVLVPVAQRPEQGVASVRSASPTVVLAATLRASDNLRAEELLATLARRFAAPGRREDALSRERAVLRRLHVDLSGVILNDGSGLDRRNRLTPRALVEVLRALYDVPYPTPGAAGLPPALYRARHNSFAELLPQAGTGESVPLHDGRGGTMALRLRGSGLDVRAKTGTLPGVSALAGYVTARSGHVLAFAVIMNGPETTPILTLRAVQDDLVAALARTH